MLPWNESLCSPIVTRNETNIVDGMLDKIKNWGADGVVCVGVDAEKISGRWCSNHFLKMLMLNSALWILWCIQQFPLFNLVYDYNLDMNDNDVLDQLKLIIVSCIPIRHLWWWILKPWWGKFYLWMCTWYVTDITQSLQNQEEHIQITIQW